MRACFYGSVKEQHGMVQEPQMIQFHKTKYIFFPQMLHNGLQERIAKQLKEAMKLQEIQVFLQPRIDLKNNKICAAEALARWKWPDGSWGLPNQFLPVLEQMNLMPIFDFHILEQVANIQRCWLQQWKTILPISVNFSAETLLQINAVERLQQVMELHSLEPEQIEIELTERCVMEHQQALFPVLKQLQEIGFKICLDDFGIGSSSLSMLLHLPVDIVKMDKSFLEKDLTNNKVYKYIMQIVKLLQVAETKIIFEGVETAEQMEILRELSVEQGQGWFWERPLHWRMFIHRYILDKVRKTCYYI